MIEIGSAMYTGFHINAGAPPVVPEMLPGHTFQQALMATMTGRDASARH